MKLIIVCQSNIDLFPDIFLQNIISSILHLSQINSNGIVSKDQGNDLFSVTQVSTPGFICTPMAST